MSSTYTDAQLQTIVVCTKVTASLSLFGVCMMITSYAMGTYGSSIKSTTITVAKFIGRWGPTSGAHSALCQAQASLIQETTLASIMIGLVISFMMLHILFLGGSVKTLEQWERAVIAGCFIAPLPFVVAPLAIETDHGSMIGDGDL
eukprot:jgi/Hompol1/1240/HPOL_003108-RA